MSIALRQTDQFIDSNGDPIVDGFLYIGEAGQDPAANPITLYESDLTTTITNPQRTDSLGRPQNDIYILGTSYSYELRDSAGVNVEGPKDRDAPGTLSSSSASSAGDIATMSFGSNVNLIQTAGPTSSILAPATYIPYEISGVRQTGTPGQHPDWGYGVVYDADGNGWILSGVIEFRQFGMVVDGTTDDTSAFREMNAFCSNFNFEPIARAGTSAFTDTLRVECIIHHEEFVYSFSGLGATDDGIEFNSANSTSNSAGLHGVYRLDMNSVGRDGIWIMQGEIASLGTGRVENAVRAGLNFECVAAFRWIEGITSQSFRVSGGQHWVRVVVPDAQANFINKISFYDFEGRRCTDYPIYVELQGSASVQKASEWAWINPEFDARNSLQEDMIFVNRTGTDGTADGWAFISPTFEDTSGTSHTYCLNASAPGIFRSASVISASRFAYPNPFHPNVTANWLDASRINVNDDGDYHNRMRRTSFERIHTGPDDTAQLHGETLLENVQRLVTSDISGGDSTRVDGATFSITLSHNGFARYEVTIIDDDANADASGVIGVVVYNSSNAMTQKVYGCTGITITSLVYDSGDNDWTLTITNDTGGTIRFRAFVTKIR